MTADQGLEERGNTRGHAAEAALEDLLPQALPLLQALVRCATVGVGPETERAVAQLVDHLAAAGCTPRVVRGADGTPTVLAEVTSDLPGPRHLLQAHLDVVPADQGWERDPFAAEVEDGTVHGRGTADTKGGLVAAVLALEALAAAGGPPRGAVGLLVDADEETGSQRGLRPFLAAHGLPGVEGAICAEPTGLRPYLGNRGLVWATLRVHGAAAHAGQPAAGRNPIPVLAALIGRLPVPAPRPGPLGSSGPSLTPTVLRAGEAVNSVPDVAEVRLDRRVLPEEDLDAVVAELRALPAALPLPAGVEVECVVDAVWPACLLDADHPLARAAAAVVAASGRDPAPGFDDASDDASFLTAAGIPTLIWGPGDPQVAHTSTESVALAEVHDAARLYLKALLRLNAA